MGLGFRLGRASKSAPRSSEGRGPVGRPQAYQPAASEAPEAWIGRKEIPKQNHTFENGLGDVLKNMILGDFDAWKLYIWSF